MNNKQKYQYSAEALTYHYAYKPPMVVEHHFIIISKAKVPTQSLVFDDKKLSKYVTDSDTNSVLYDVDAKWDLLFSQSQDILAALAQEAREDYRKGNTISLSND